MLDLSSLPRFKRDERFVKRLPFLWPEWEKLFSLVALEKEALYAHEWLSRNQPGYKDMGRYLLNWFRRCQKREEEHRELDRRFGERRQTLKPYKEDKPPEEEIMTGEDFRRMREHI